MRLACVGRGLDTARCLYLSRSGETRREEEQVHDGRKEERHSCFAAVSRVTSHAGGWLRELSGSGVERMLICDRQGSLLSKNI